MSSQPVRQFSDPPDRLPGGVEKPPVPTAVPPPASDRIGPYRIVKPLGEGGLGTVFSAEGELGSALRQVALRVIQRGDLERVGVQNFVDHQKLLTRIDHPNLARVLDAGISSQGDAFVATELVQGKRIDEYCLDKALPLINRVRILTMVCKGVAAMHRSLFLCGSVKPAGVLVSPEGSPLLIDLLAEPRTAPSIRKLNFDYASPEQIRGEPLTTATDVYLLGILIHEVTTGRTPFALRSLSAAEALSKLLDFSLAKTLLPKELDAVLMKAMSPLAADRYPSVADLIQDLERFLNERPAANKASTAGKRLVGPSGQNYPALFIAGASGMLLLTGFALWTGYAASRDRDIAQRRFESLRVFADTSIAEMPDALASVPGAGKLRSALVGRAVQYLDHLAADAGKEPFLQAEIARGYRRMARVQEDAGSPAPAPAELLAKAQHQLETAVQAQPQQLDWACELGWIQLEYSDAPLLNVNQRDNAVGAADKYWRALQRSHPTESRVMLGVAAAAFRVGARANDAHLKRSNYEQALSIYQQLLSGKQNDPGMIRDAARAHRALAALSDPQTRLSHVRAAIQLDDRLLKIDPQARVDYGVDLTELSSAYQAAGDVTEAANTMERVIAIRRKVAEADPSSDQSSGRLANALNQAALLAYRQGDPESARSLYGEVIARFSKSQALQRSGLLAEAYSGLAEVDDKDGHTMIACSSLAIARENLNGAKALGADQKKRVLDRIENLSSHCPK